LTYKAKPNFKELGKKFGSRMPQIKAAIEALSSDDLAKGFEKQQWHISVDGIEHALTSEEIQVAPLPKEPFALATDKDVTVALDKTITAELRAEGYAREIVNRVQNTRKEAGFDVTDRIILSLVSSNKDITDAVKKHSPLISEETLSTEILFEKPADVDFSKKWELGSDEIVISVKKK